MSVAERIGQSVASSGAVDLTAAGSIEEITAEAPSLGESAYAPLVADAFVSVLQSQGRSEEWLVALRRFVAGFDAQRSYLSLRESADALLQAGMLDTIGDTVHDALFPRRDLIVAHPLLAGLRLNIVLEVVVLTGHSPYRVLDALTQPLEDLPQEFDDPLAHAIGVAVDLWRAEAEQIRFASTLDALAGRGSEDAIYERALQQLRRALEEQDRLGLIALIGDAADRFEALASQVEDRTDAQALASVCRAIIAFDDADRATLESAAHMAHDTAARRALHLHGLHSRSAALARQASELAWTSLASHLESAHQHLSEDTFLDTWAAVEAITKVYEADRRVSDLNTVRVVIEPRIVNGLATRHAMAHQLKRAVDVDRARDAPILPSEIYELLDLVQQAGSTPRECEDDAEEDSQRGPFLHALLGSDAELLSGLSDDKRAALEEAARRAFVGTFAGDRPTNDLVARLTAGLMSELSEHPAFTGTVRSNFSLLLLNTVRFLVYVGDTRQTYTLPIDAEHPAPLEAALQKHFAEFLSATELAGRVGIEYPNIANGRADVIVTFDGAQRYVTEVKRELSDAGRSSVESGYLAQALEYQSTSEPFGQLLVLDLTDHYNGTPHLNDSIWVTHRRDPSQQITSSAVTAIVRGNRPSPSAMR